MNGLVTDLSHFITVIVKSTEDLHGKDSPEFRQLQKYIPDTDPRLHGIPNKIDERC